MNDIQPMTRLFGGSTQTVSRVSKKARRDPFESPGAFFDHFVHLRSPHSQRNLRVLVDDMLGHAFVEHMRRCDQSKGGLRSFEFDTRHSVGCLNLYEGTSEFEAYVRHISAWFPAWIEEMGGSVSATTSRKAAAFCYDFGALMLEGSDVPSIARRQRQAMADFFLFVYVFDDIVEKMRGVEGVNFSSVLGNLGGFLTRCCQAGLSRSPLPRQPQLPETSDPRVSALFSSGRVVHRLFVEMSRLRAYFDADLAMVSAQPLFEALGLYFHGCAAQVRNSATNYIEYVDRHAGMNEEAGAARAAIAFALFVDIWPRENLDFDLARLSAADGFASGASAKMLYHASRCTRLENDLIDTKHIADPVAVEIGMALFMRDEYPMMLDALQAGYEDGTWQRPGSYGCHEVGLFDMNCPAQHKALLDRYSPTPVGYIAHQRLHALLIREFHALVDGVGIYLRRAKNPWLADRLVEVTLRLAFGFYTFQPAATRYAPAYDAYIAAAIDGDFRAYVHAVNSIESKAQLITLHDPNGQGSGLGL